jgi:hypothetical protein
MSDWQVGDLALCIAEMFDDAGEPSDISPGSIHTVTEILRGSFDWRSGLHFAVALGLQGWPHLYDADDFRRIPPHTPDEEDAETIRLLNGQPEVVA